MPRHAAIVVALAVIAGAGWWLVCGPAIVHATAPPPSDIDLDSPATRAQREAVIALATMPDDPWTFAESLAASAPDKAVDKERCGVEDGPQFSTPVADGEMPVQTRAQTVRHLNAEARIDAALRSSADPFDRAVADLVNAGGMRSDAGRDEAVVQQAVATSDPRLYALGYGLCHSMRAAAPSCARISAARWAQVDAGNGMPWLNLLAQAQAAGDIAGVRDAMAQLASSSRFDAYPSAAAGAVAGRSPQEGADLDAANELMFTALGQAMSAWSAPYSPLVQLCKDHAGGDETFAQQCRAISETMFGHSDNLMSLSVSGALLFQLTGDPSRRDFVRAERTALAAHWSPATGFSLCQDMRDAIRFQLRSAQVGEVEAMRERARRFVTP